MESLLLTAIVIEIRSLSFYRSMSSKVSDSSSRLFFEILADDESEHLKLFCSYYPGNNHDLVDILIKNNIYAFPSCCSMLNSFGDNISAKDALKIALSEELACVECYTGFMKNISEQPIRDVFEHILNETRKHCEMIDLEYMRKMDDVDRHVHANNRSHIRQSLNN